MAKLPGGKPAPTKLQKKQAKNKKPRAVAIGERVVKAIDSLNPFD